MKLCKEEIQPKPSSLILKARDEYCSKAVESMGILWVNSLQTHKNGFMQFISRFSAAADTNKFS